MKEPETWLGNIRKAWAQEMQAEKWCCCDVDVCTYCSVHGECLRGER